jgi:RNA polymerase-binding transcription factor DksA
MSAQPSLELQGHRIQQEMNQVRTSLQLINERFGQGLSKGGDLIDQANSRGQMDTDQALRDLYQQKLRRLEQVWGRFCQGQYGVCKSCGESIDPARLDMLPDTALCVSCQRQEELRAK